MDPVFFIKSTKIEVFYRYGYTDITTFRDPWAEEHSLKHWTHSCQKELVSPKSLHRVLAVLGHNSKGDIRVEVTVWRKEAPPVDFLD